MRSTFKRPLRLTAILLLVITVFLPLIQAQSATTTSTLTPTTTTTTTTTTRPTTTKLPTLPLLPSPEPQVTHTVLLIPVKFIILIAVAALFVGGCCLLCLGVTIFYSIVKLFACCGCSPCVNALKRWEEENRKRMEEKRVAELEAQGGGAGVEAGAVGQQPVVVPQMETVQGHGGLRGGVDDVAALLPYTASDHSVQRSSQDNLLQRS
ncbi:hypothetical protein HDV00_007877 [Rhizophlyctis rosea]|nr:hypothetical protein HDV00_007877 [Rhizophlyctis rosea]